MNAGTISKQIFTEADVTSVLPQDAFHHDIPNAHKLHGILYTHPVHNWKLAIATVAERGAMSLGGFRIAPKERRQSPGFSAVAEASALAIGMEEKVYWSRKFSLAGPVGRQELPRIFGGKCVLDAGDKHKVGETGDTELLEFTCEVFHSFENETGISLVTGQDLGHGLLTSGESSLHFLTERFRGCVEADTSAPTAYGNLGVIIGIATALGKELPSLRVGLLGCGNIGKHLATALLQAGASVVALDSSPSAKSWCEERGVEFYPADKRSLFLSQSVDIFCINAAGRSLDETTVDALCGNNEVLAVTGCENLVFTDATLESAFHQNRKLFTPTEYCGMFGYLTAVETYLNPSVKVEEMKEAALAIQHSSRLAVTNAVASNYAHSYRSALLDIGNSPEEQVAMQG